MTFNQEGVGIYGDHVYKVSKTEGGNWYIEYKDPFGRDAYGVVDGNNTYEAFIKETFSNSNYKK